MKKIIVLSILIFTICIRTIPANATSYGSSISGMIYDIYGKLTLTINIKDYAGLTVTLPKVEKFKEFFGFSDYGYFYDLLLFTLLSSDYGSYVTPPTWYQSGSTFVVDLSSLVNQVNSTFGQYGSITSTKPAVLTGKIRNNATSISGKLSLAWNFSTYLEEYGYIYGSISISMSYKGRPSTIWHWASTKEQATVVNNKGYPSNYWYIKLSNGRFASLKNSIKNVLDSYFRGTKRF
jgi:hypothetical protein